MNSQEALQHYLQSSVDHDQEYVIEGQPNIVGIGWRGGVPTFISRPESREHIGPDIATFHRLQRDRRSQQSRAWPPRRWAHT